ncbi:MAG: hypothetical protein ACXVO9_15510 [Bacteroidia bacterium]
MNIKKVVSFLCLIIAAIIFMNASGGEKDPLHKRIFNVGITEVKDGQAAKKSISDKIEFKDGKLFSDFLFDKFQYKWIKYRINKDSIYTDETETEVRLLEVEASTTDDKDQTLMMTFKVEEWDIEGVIKITKNDKLKKYFDFTGFEKGGKPKKEKKKKKENNEATETKKE